MTDLIKKHEPGWYYIEHDKFSDGTIDYLYPTGEWKFSNKESVKKIIAPVPSFEEWQDGIFNFNILKMSLNGREKREKQLKELLKECQTIISNNLYEFDSDDCSRSCDLIKEIEEALR